jgi:hypothetical protein
LPVCAGSRPSSAHAPYHDLALSRGGWRPASDRGRALASPPVVRNHRPGRILTISTSPAEPLATIDVSPEGFPRSDSKSANGCVHRGGRAANSGEMWHRPGELRLPSTPLAPPLARRGRRCCVATVKSAGPLAGQERRGEAAGSGQRRTTQVRVHSCRVWLVGPAGGLRAMWHSC